MKKEIRLEFLLGNVSMNTLWECIGTPSGLSGWFSDDVKVTDDRYTFVWGKSEQSAVLTKRRINHYVRFYWEDESPKFYFEMRITQVELTNDIILQVVDYADENEEEELADWWNNQIESLCKRLGV